MNVTNIDSAAEIEESSERSGGVGRRQIDPADLARLNQMIDEWGQQSFPASDPPPTW